MVLLSENVELLPRKKVTQKSLYSHCSLENDFPAIEISKLAEKESWRKEVHRPATHTHKWWAKRLGTVFRGIIVAAASKNKAEAIKKYSQPLDLSNLTLFDPFAGSGTTLVEAKKLGIRTIGRDINPVATLVERQALAHWDKTKLYAAFSEIEKQCRSEIEKYYRTQNGETVLYYFWVATTKCPDCNTKVDLFSSRIFSRHAYPKKHPQAKAVCVECGEIVNVNYDDTTMTCANRHNTTIAGAVSGQNMTCANGHVNKIVPSLKGGTPKHRMYAKLVLTKGGTKHYEKITDYDTKLYTEVERDYKKLKQQLIVPVGQLEDGVNTRQAKSWGFNSWDKFFNTRQLLALGLLATAIKNLKVDNQTREAMATLFSGTLEFNNLFCSFKGEGTGAVRHMFSHHILKPERTPLEANPWGTKASSGSFSTLFSSRLLRAYNYKKLPSDLVLVHDQVEKTEGISEPLDADISESWKDFVHNPSSVYILAGDSSKTDIPNSSVDLVITDPPYMDNVHYSELADFFHAWLKQIKPYENYDLSDTTRSVDEVQSPSPDDFSKAIERVWAESARVLKKDGLVAFTFHQARISGWVALVKALKNAGLVVTAIQPIKGEMSTSVVKAGASKPSNLDSIVVCRKQKSTLVNPAKAETKYKEALDRLADLQKEGIKVGYTDVCSVIRGTVLAMYTDSQNTYDTDKLSKLANEYAEVAATKLNVV